LLDEACALAAGGHGVVPPAIGPIPADRAPRRQFSFSRLSGKFVSTRTADDAGATGSASAPGVTAGLSSSATALLCAGLPTSHVETEGLAGATGSASAPQAKPLLDARGLGSLVHDVLERLDVRSTNLEPEIAAWCEHLAPQYVVQHAGEAARLASAMVARFASSPRARQLADAKALHREIEFLLAWPLQGVAGVERSEPPVRDAGRGSPITAAVVPARPQPSGGRYIRGYIDCLYQDSAGVWRIVDYKTNDVPPGDVERTAKDYELQLYVYAMAAEKALGASPIELVLELLRPGAEHVFAWNDAARERAIKMVNEAIDAAIVDPQPPAPSP
jgi:hypothetical protein